MIDTGDRSSVTKTFPDFIYLWASVCNLYPVLLIGLAPEDAGKREASKWRVVWICLTFQPWFINLLYICGKWNYYRRQ